MSNHIPSKNPIRKLPISLSNQIAAGEVVERPASILKELIENSIDAGAKHIRIDIVQAGLERISVTDDGHGIPANELCLAVSPHATSKLHTQEQLGHINTLGFRGEALASIASVSKFEILSRVADDDTAWKLDYSNENSASYDLHDLEKLKPVPIAHPIGTTVSANNIFYNTPARKKYLRTERTEYLHVERVIKQLLLSDFNTGFTFIHNEREIYRLQQALDQQSKARRVLKICGKTFYDNTVSLNFEASGMRLTGWLAKQNYSRSSADIQYFYINGRIIRDRFIFHAIRSAFSDKIPEGRYVAYILYLTINTESIDVNVHPTKHEVRFVEMRIVHDFLTHVITKALNFNITNEPNLKYLTDNFPVVGNTNHNVIRDSSSDYNIHSEKIRPPSFEYNFFFGKILKILEHRYIMIDSNNALIVIDTLKAQSYIKLYNLKLEFKDDKIKPKPLLIPSSITLKKNQIDSLESQVNTLNNLGIEFTVTGIESLLLRAIPVVLRNVDYCKLLRNMANFLIENSQFQINELLAILCSSELVVTSKFDFEAATLLIIELNELNNTAVMANENIWWHNIEPDDLTSLFNKTVKKLL